MRAIIVLIAFAAAVAGCAKQKGAPPAGGAESSAKGLGPVATPGFRVETLGLDLAGPATNDPAIPGTDGFQGGLVALDPAFLSEELILRKTLNLPDSGTGHGPYFVWPQSVGKNQIDNAWYAVRTQGTDGRLVGEPNYELANLDRDGKRFFIPLYRALSRRVQDLGPSDEQILMIRLQFTAGGVVDLTLRFRVAGALVPLSVIRNEVVSPALNASLLRQAVAIPFRRVTFQNPMARPVTLWLKDASTRMRLVALDLFDTGPVDTLVQIEAMMSTEVLVTQGGRSHSFVTGPAGSEPTGWHPVRFQAGEQVTLEWLARTRNCSAYLGGSPVGTVVGLLVDGAWATDTWVTDGSLPALPANFATLPKSLSIDAGRMSSNYWNRTGNWDDSPSGILGCQ